MRAKPGYISLKVFSTTGPGRVTGQSHVAAHQDSPPETEHRLERLRVLVVGELVGQEPHHSALHHRPIGESFFHIFCLIIYLLCSEYGLKTPPGFVPHSDPTKNCHFWPLILGNHKFCLTTPNPHVLCTASGMIKTLRSGVTV